MTLPSTIVVDYHGAQHRPVKVRRRGARRILRLYSEGEAACRMTRESAPCWPELFFTGTDIKKMGGEWMEAGGRMVVGYARVSTRRQRPDLQLRALAAAKCDIVISEHRSGRGGIGKGLLAAIGSCGKGDTLVVWRLDRLGRNLRELLALSDLLTRRGVALRVLSGAASAIDLTQAEGLALYAAYAALAELELGMNRDRTLAGLEAARRSTGCELSEPGMPKVREWPRRALRNTFNRAGRAGRSARRT